MTDKFEKRSTIVDAAQNLFARFGLAKTTIEDIAKKVGMGKASLYYYFRSKESIFKEVVAKEGKTLKEKILKAVNSQNTPQDKIRSYFITRMTEIKSLSNYYSAIKDDYLLNYAFIEQARKEYDTFEVTLVSSMLQEGVHKDIFTVEDVTLTAETILAALKGLEYQWSYKISNDQIEKNIKALLRILFTGIELKV
jgi:AcrR family transcriptional regulator